ncbi:MAG: N-acetylneuraminate cytidylyltransferase NeuA [Parcubacteria group bacterium Gr01-1014_48]|nr:MAG: N-acetylneuraminate cytidylyltransferase NeuA [Parcubacteria group bacterium Greene0416_14]TSC74454.1 MAG: N-acetylneuraminate cytidylyltransferase NeuA [Parcubacteria group bacterium Gr01-1014_48]TSD01764.1 MAG: N-acetylneuraminate cytidylyltransferase NeuA [Parcubacteria group bacterium Greene1014_15]TSD08478.1 MAG: N-acetylneuraminate cytidylyltransferase NeuA [Parcubacteria group bacterium Greene0714_4]
MHYTNTKITKITSHKKTGGEEAKKPLILGVIPARGGSKSVPRKNIKLLGGKPLLYYMLTAALGSVLLDRVVVSSEDDEILRIAKKYGGNEVLLRRPKKLALDKTPDVPMLQHAVKAVEKIEKCMFDYVVQLHVTTPFVSSEDIDRALRMLLQSNAQSIVSVCQVNEYHPIKLKKITDGRLVQYVEGLEERSTVRRQDLPPVYWRNGGLYASRREVIMEHGRVFGDHVLPYVMPSEKSVDMNSIIDFWTAEAVLKNMRLNKK